ncbi:polysaccharide pyruvyl transferase family protein [Oribacterium sp. P6A1]|uniref:polysaccharide pyruvyl transferase family protein n=1 Tax=Oribacterium sp. P6A1 TaxID=1410612 RepID=UPI00068B2A49|nr:polysaccharide pyruvyl transferase family protein [Oribacterium sp. P6A1]
MTYVAFGVGQFFHSFLERLDTIIGIEFFCDNDSRKWGQYLMGDDRVCISPEDLKKINDPMVIICSAKDNSVRDIGKQLEEQGIPYISAKSFLHQHEIKNHSVEWPQKIQKTRIHKFIELLVNGTTACNLHCEYCYVWRSRGFQAGRISSEYSADEIRKALSLERLGGPCHINLCALGETLISEGIIRIVRALTEEGHYLGIVTNGTISPAIDEILLFDKDLQEKIFFKISYHKKELERLKLVDVFWNNVEKIKSSACSFTLEITPSDLLIDETEEIKKEFSIRMGGALPHITFTRDSQKEGLDLYSELSLDEYRRIWGQFESCLFNLKSYLYKRKITENCYAGCWSYRINLVNGNLQSCYKQQLSGTIYDHMESPFQNVTVKNKCAQTYCFNNHAFIAWGDVPDIECDTYLAMRDRIEKDGTVWIKKPYRALMNQKLYDNNFPWIDRWSDYPKLFRAEREGAFILFNSPDYGNLGDQAIAYSERVFFSRLFPDKEFIEISCTQYIKECLQIKKAVRNDDVILLTGGGYMGSIWLWLEDMVINILEQFPDNRVVIMPQTIFFEDDQFGHSERYMFEEAVIRHGNVHIFARDVSTYEYLKKSSIDDSCFELANDMAMALDIKSNALEKNQGKVLICLRKDEESVNYDRTKLIEEIEKIFGNETVEFSTVVEENVFLDDRERYLSDLWSQMSKAELIITDRLHASIFSCLLSIPCFALSNSTGKVRDFCDRYGDLYDIRLAKDEDEVVDFAKEYITPKPKRIKKHENINEHFMESVTRYFKEKCFV